MLFDAFAPDRTITWDERITLRERAPINNDYFQVVTWRGARWKLFVRKNTKYPFIDVYAMILNEIELPSNWSCPVRFTFTLLTPSGRRSKYARDTEYEFRKELFVKEGADRGFSEAFSYEAIKECAIPTTSEDVGVVDDTSGTGGAETGTDSAGGEVEVEDIEDIEGESFGDEEGGRERKRIKATGNSSSQVDNENTYTFVLRCEIDGMVLDRSTPAECRRLTGMVGIENLGATCYLNALLQMLFHVNAFRRIVYSLPHESATGKPSVILALQSLFHHLQTSTSAATTQALTRSFGWNTADAFQQQDVQEMMRVLIDKLEEYAKGSPLEPALKHLFSGVLRSYIRCLNIDYVSQRDEEFYDIQLDVKGFADVYASFDSYIAKEILNGDNKYDAGEGRGKQDAEKGVVFRKFPPVLTIHLKRFAFDVERMCFAKIHDHFEFPTVLDLNKYLSADESEDETDKSQNIYRLHSVLVHSGEVYGGHYYAFIRAMREESFGGPTSWIGEAPVPTDSEPESSASYQARLIEWRDRRGSWYKFDDDYVTCVTEREAVDKCYGRDTINSSTYGTGTSYAGSVSSAYMLVYIRENDAAEIMKPLSSADIPASLQNHLKEEERRAQLSNLMVSIHEEKINVRFVTTEDMKEFSAYNLTADFVDVEHRAQVVSISKKSTNLALLLSIAASLQLSPDAIRLWTMRRRNKRVLYRPFALISVDSLKDVMSPALSSYEVIYVEILEGWQLSPNRQEIESGFLSLQHKEDEWIDSVLSELKGCFEITLEQERELAASIGVGAPKHALTLLPDMSREAYETTMSEIEEEYLEAFDAFPHILRSVPHFLTDTSSNSSNSTSSNNANSSSYMSSQSDEDTVTETEDCAVVEDDSWTVSTVTKPHSVISAATANSSNGTSTFTSNTYSNGVQQPQAPTVNLLIIKIFDPRLISTSTGCPISFATTRIRMSNDSCKSLMNMIRDAIAEAASIGVVDLSEWEEIDVYSSAHSRNIVKLENNVFSKRKTLKDFDINCGETIYIQSRNIPTAEELGLDDYYANVESWLQFECDKMTVELRPVSATDFEIISHRRGVWRLVPEEYRNNATITSLFTNDGGRNLKYPLLQTSASATGLQLLNAIAKRLCMSNYKFLAVTPSDALRFDYLKDFSFIDGTDLKTSVLDILRSRNLSQTTRYFYISIMPFDSIVFGNMNSKPTAPPRSNCIDITGDEDDKDTTGASTSNSNTISPLRASSTLHGPSVDKFTRYLEVSIADAKARDTRRQFIIDSIITPAIAANSSSSGTTTSSIDHTLASPSKRLKTDTGSTAVITSTTTSTSSTSTPSKSTSSTITFPHPVALDDIQTGYIEPDKVFARIDCIANKTRMYEIASEILRNFSTRDAFESFIPGQSALRRNSNTILSLREILKAAGIDSLEVLQDYSGFSELVELKRRESNRGILGARTYSTSGNTTSNTPLQILDFFTSRAPAVYDVIIQNSGLSDEERERQLDSKEPLLLLYTAKKKIRTLLQPRFPVQEFGLLPRTMMDYFSEGPNGKSSAPINGLNVCMQFITREDELWMRGLMPKLKSCVVSVYLFTVNPVTHIVNAIAGAFVPFLSYITELDTYDALVNRLRSVIGDTQVVIEGLTSRKMPLCLIKDDRYTPLLPIDTDSSSNCSSNSTSGNITSNSNTQAEDVSGSATAPTGSTGTSTDATSAIDDSSGSDSSNTPWAVFETLFPNRVFDNFTQYRTMNGCDANQIPELGILVRNLSNSTSNTAHPAVADESRKRKSAVGIKIN